MPALRPARFALRLSPLLLLLGACTGKVDGAPTPGSPGTGGPGPATGTGSTGGGLSGGGQTGGSSGGGTGGTGSSTGGASGADPYAIPASPPAAALVPTSRTARLSRLQWANAARDLLKLKDITEIDRGVSGDALIGFDDEGDALFVTEQLRKDLFDASEKLADKVIADAAVLASLVPANAPSDTAGKGRAFITSFGLRAFRRPLTDAEITTHVGLFNQGPTLYPGVDAFKAGVSLVIQAMLQSPHFLYRTELTTAPAGASRVALNDYEVAAKIALALTNTIPDETLLAAAAAGQLRDKTALLAQVKRLIEGPTGAVGLNNFNFQVYRLGTYDGIVRDAKDYPDFKPTMPAAMRQEVLTFVDWIFAEGMGIKDLYSKPVGFVNATLAPLYGVTATGDALTKVDLDPQRRAGLLTQAGFLSSYAKGPDPDIIHRGVFIAERVLCKELPPPDPNATTLPPPSGNLTNRQLVEKTTGKGTCGQSCHGAFMNPLGFAFENYDAIGKYRTTDRNMPIDAADSYTLDGQLKTYTNGVELSRLLSEAKEVHDCYVKNMMTYLHGRVVAPEEKAMVDYYARLSRAGMVSLRDLERNIVTSDSFLNRLP